MANRAIDVVEEADLIRLFRLLPAGKKHVILALLVEMAHDNAAPESAPPPSQVFQFPAR